MMNNATENAIRPIALGKKNWLHLGERSGGNHVLRPLQIGDRIAGRADRPAVPAIREECFLSAIAIFYLLPSTGTSSGRWSLVLGH